MATAVERAKLVKFCLADLAGENGHHTFEHLCRHVARLRIASNVLPATGPVSAGGDQGRDFETFRTYLLDELPFAIGFLAQASSETIAFACTIQRDKLKRKFEQDITAICTQGTHVDHVVVFAVADVTTRVRHGLQDWARTQFGVTLDIYDGTALSELIADNSLYWVAEQFLNLPAELAITDTEPPPDDPPDWYASLREYWQAIPCPPATLGDMLEIRRGLRHSLSPGPCRADIDGWISLMRQVCEKTPSSEVRLRAVYELTIAQHRGKADLRPVENLVRRYVKEVLEAEDPTTLFDASLVIQTMETAAVSGQTGISLPETCSWIEPLRNHIDRLLIKDRGPNEKAGLLQAAAHLGTHLDWTGIEASAAMPLDLMDDIQRSLADAIDSGNVQAHIGAAPLIDIDYAMSRLSELVDVLPTAPAYPLDGFVTLIDLLTPSLRDHHLYRRVCDGIDDAVRRQVGEAAVAERCRQRAFSLMEVDRPLEALREFHEATTNWFHGDTFSDSLNAVGAIAGIYDYLGMHLAAKRYALGLAMLAQQSPDPHDRPLVPRAIAAASISDHNAGAWLVSADLTAIAALAHVAYSPNAHDAGDHEYLLEAVGRQVITVAAAQRLRPQFLEKIVEIFAEGPITDLVASGTEDFLGAEDLQSEEDLFGFLRDDVGPPFSDVSPERVIVFKALGVQWTIHGRNDEENVLAIEDFASTLQILLVEIASDDAVIIPGDIDIEIRIGDTDELYEDSRTVTDSGGTRWELALPSHSSGVALEVLRTNMYAKAFTVLEGNSLLDEARFEILVDRAARGGLFKKFEVGHRSYRHLATFRSRNSPPLREQTHRPISRPETVAPQVCSLHLGSRGGPGPGYTAQKAQSILAERYELLPRPIRYTLPRLMQKEEVRLLFHELRERDLWKDWHIMSVVMSLVVTQRITARCGPLTEQNADEFADQFHSEALREETEGDAGLDPALITRESMESGIAAVAISSLGRWGLALHYPSHSPSAIMHVLATRYGFWNDDIPHDDSLFIL